HHGAGRPYKTGRAPCRALHVKAGPKQRVFAVLQKIILRKMSILRIECNIVSLKADSENFSSYAWRHCEQILCR
ncbi:MAG: hypothetical protein PVG36_09365, partial [Methyloceanibacter sp.]